MEKEHLEDGCQAESLMKETPYIVGEGDGAVAVESPYVVDGDEGGCWEDFTVDQLSDEELFVMDALSRCGPENVTDEEVEGMLVEAKRDAEGWRKMMDSIRGRYKAAEVRISAEGTADDGRADAVS